MFESIFGFNSMYSSTSDSGDASYTNSELLGAYKNLSYLECKDIYRFWPLGKRIASALPRFALSAKRAFVVKEAPREVNEKLAEISEELDIDGIVLRTSIYARVYGLACIYVATDVNRLEGLTYKQIQNAQITFNVLDPLAMGGSIVVDNDPLSVNFSKPVAVQIQGHEVSPSRMCIVYNDIPLYYKFNPSSFSFSGPSIYQNMTLLIRSWNRCIIAMQRLATKAASIIKTTKDNANISGISLQAIERNLALIRSIENDGIASIRSGDELQFFNLTGVNEVDAIIQQLNTALMMALSDTPSGILLDKNLSVGLNDGSEDMKAILMAVEHFRVSMLLPMYKFLDKFLCHKAFSPQFIKTMKEQYPDLYRELSPNQILTKWLQDYSFEWGELYPQNENEKADTDSKLLDNLVKIKELGAEASSLEEAINEHRFFETEFVLNEENIEGRGEEEQQEGFGDDDGLDDENSQTTKLREKDSENGQVD